MASNVSPLVQEIRNLKNLEEAIRMVSNNSNHPRGANVLLKKEIIDRVAVLCHSFLKKYESTPWFDEIRTDGTYADLFGMLHQVLEELRK